jgi:hypothetical protein
MAQATYDDVNLILKLYEMRREEKMRASRAWFFANCKPKTMADLQQIAPPGSGENAAFRQVASYWDMAASFVTSGVLNDVLLFQNNRELLFVWLRVQPIIADLRAAFKDPNYMKNLETVGNSFIDYLNGIDPETVPAFKARVVG